MLGRLSQLQGNHALVGFSGDSEKLHVESLTG